MLTHPHMLGALFLGTSLCMTLLPTSQAHARRMGPGEPTVSVGVKGSIGAATLASDSVSSSNTGSILGYSIGAQARFQLHPMAVFQPELGYASRGSTFVILGFESSQRLNYLHAPLLFGLTYPMGLPSELNPRLLIGPYVSYLLGGEATLGDLTQEIDSDNVAALDAGIVIGFGLDIDMGGFTLTSDVRLERGLIGLSSPSENVAYGNDQFNQVLSLNVGALFVF